MKPSIRFGASLAALTVAAGSIGLVASAQEEPATEDEARQQTVVITGIRGSLTDAASIKRNADGVVDAISAEDIGKFPDTNLAESLQRITGVSIDRSNGEGNQISVRGFGPSFNLVTLNGRQMPGASSPKQENADSQLQPRSFNFAEISADSVSGVEVYKTTRVDLPSGGIGATVNVKTARPLSLDEFVAAGSIKAQMDTSNEVGDDITPEVTGILSKSWDLQGGGQFGLLFNGSYSERDSREEIVSTDGWLRNDPASNAAFAANVDTSAVDPDRNPGVIYSPRNLVTDFSDHERTRTNAQIVAQYAPTDRMTATLDYTYSDYEDQIERTQTAVWFDQNIVAGTANANGTIINPSITSDLTTFGAFDFNAYSDEVKTTNKSVGFNFDWQVTDALQLNFDFHDSESHAQPDGQSSDFLAIIAGPLGTSYSVDYGTGSDVPILSFTNAPGVDPTDVTAYRPNITLARGNEMLNEIQEFNLRGSWENGTGSVLKSIDFGGGFIDYSVDTTFTFDLVVYDGVAPAGGSGGLVSVIPRGGVGSEFSGGNSLPPFFGQYNAAQMQAFYDGAGIARVFELFTPVTNEISEETTSFYVNFNFEEDFNNMPLRVSAGVRYESTETTGGTLGFPPSDLTWISSTELRASNSANEQLFTLDGEYDVFLPSIDASLEVVDDLIVRASYGRSLSRPDLNRLRPNLAITDTRPGGPYQASQGNPSLLPYISDNLDASVEWYYGAGSYASVSVFKKFVDNYITSTVRDGTIFSEQLGCDLTDPSIVGINPPDIDGDGASDPVVGTCSDPTAVFNISSVENGEAAEVDGVELAVQHLFGDTGFGVQANYTLVEGDVEFDTASLTQSVALIGLSDSANLVAFYENYGWQARVAYNWRDEFLFAVDQLRQPGEPVFVDEYGQWDVSASYDVSDRFTVFLEGLNLTDEITTAHGRYDEQFLYAFHGGPRYTFGVRGKF